MGAPVFAAIISLGSATPTGTRWTQYLAVIIEQNSACKSIGQIIKKELLFRILIILWFINRLYIEDCEMSSIKKAVKNLL